MADKLSQTKLENKSGFYLFYNIDLAQIPQEAWGKFLQIYDDYYKNPGDVQPTQKSLMKAFKLLFAGPDAKLTEKERNALKALDRSEWYPNLQKDAIKEFERAKDRRLWDFWKKLVFLEHVMRHPKKMATIDKVSKLRCKVRKEHRLSRTSHVGF